MDFRQCEKIFDGTCKIWKLNEAIVLIEDGSGNITWNKGWNRTVDSQFNLASITKLFVTTCILQLYEQKKLNLKDCISTYLDGTIMKGLHIYHGIDYSNQLTISDLLFQVSGLPDYYLKKSAEGVSFEQLMWDHNQYIPFDEMIETSKTMKPVFEPRHPGRSYYADINFDLLGKIIENIYGMKLQEVVKQQIFEPLGLQHTFIIESENDVAPKAYRKGVAHSITRFLLSCPASGGGVTTAREFMIFLKAFWKGQLFSKALFEQLKEHNKLQFCYGSIQYSGGHMYLYAGYPFVKKNELRGHSGASGSFAFYCEETDMFFIGDLNDSRVYIPTNMMLRMEYHCRP